MSKYYVFYADLLYGEYKDLRYLHSFPDKVYIYEQDDKDKVFWYLKDLTPVLPEDVPKKLKVLKLLLSI